MKQIRLRAVPYGTAFRAFNDEFIALDYIDGSVLAIRKDIWKSAPFDEEGGNDLRTATIKRHLGEYYSKLVSGMEPEDYAHKINLMTIDLKAADGTREYGTWQGMVGLLTLEQYGKYQHIIPDVDDWWWLATPWKTPHQKNGNTHYAWRVDSNGSYGNYRTYNAGGIRPALYFASNLLVSIEDDDDADSEEDAALEEAVLYSAYRSYVKEWLGGEKDVDVGESPLSFEDWKNVKEELGK